MRFMLLAGLTMLVAGCSSGSKPAPTPDTRPTAAVIVSTSTPEPTPSATQEAGACKFVPPENFESVFSNAALDYGPRGRPDGIGVVFKGADRNGNAIEIAVPTCARVEALHLYNVANGKE